MTPRSPKAAPRHAPPGARARLRHAVLAALVLLVLASAPAAAGVVEGQVFDATGRPLAGLEIAIVEQARGLVLPLPGLDRPPAESVIARATTDRGGFFRIELPPLSTRHRIVARCDRPGGWDGVRYRRPRPRELTDRLARGDDVVIAWLVEDAPGWAELSAAIARAGGVTTDRGRVLRRHGAPPEVVTGADGSVEWRYPGVTYRFDGEVLIRATGTAAARGVGIGERPDSSRLPAEGP